VDITTNKLLCNIDVVSIMEPKHKDGLSSKKTGTKAVPNLMEGGRPTFKDQVQSCRSPENVAQLHQNLPTTQQVAVTEENGYQAPSLSTERILPNFKDQVCSVNDNTTTPHGAIRIAPPGHQEPESDKELSHAGVSPQESIRHPGDPSLINAILVDSNAISQAEVVVEKKWTRNLILVSLLVVIMLTVGVIAGICGDGSCSCSRDNGIKVQVGGPLAPNPLHSHCPCLHQLS